MVSVTLKSINVNTIDHSIDLFQASEVYTQAQLSFIWFLCELLEHHSCLPQ